MSLTSMLAKKDLPLRWWFEEHLPDLRMVTDAWVAAGPPTTFPPPGVNAGMIGQAIDYRIRFFFAAETFDSLYAARMNRTFPNGCTSSELLELIGARYATLLAETPPTGALQAPDVELDWAAVCFLLAYCDAHVRTSMTHTSLFDPLAAGCEWDDVAALVPAEAASDLVALASAVVSTRVSGWFHRPYVLNPTFGEGSAMVGGADGDLIVDRCLYEIKTTARKQRTPDRDWVYQVIGYALLDFDDAYDIDRVGFVLPRVPAVIDFDLEELIASAASGRTASKELLREHLRSKAWLS